MGDDNEIRQLVAQVSKESLEQSFELIKKETQDYNLDHEFAKTGKHRSWFVIALASLTVLLLGASAWLAVALIEKQASRQKVDISSFEDLNLKDLLNVAKRTEEEFRLHQSELLNLERQREQELSVIEANYLAGLQLIEAGRESDSEKAARRRVLTNERNEAIRLVEEKYSALILQKRVAMDEAAARLEQYDSRSLEQAKKNEELLAAERRLFEMDKARLTEEFARQLASVEKQMVEERERFEKNQQQLVATLRRTQQAELEETKNLYNPLFSDPEVMDILKAPLFDPAGLLFDPFNMRSAAANTNPISVPQVLDRLPQSLRGTRSGITELLEQARNQELRLKRLHQALSKVPYFNSVPPSLGALRDSALALASLYAEMAWLAGQQIDNNLRQNAELQQQQAELAKTLTALRTDSNRKETELDRYRSAFSRLADLGGDAGFVVAVEDARCLIWLKPGMASLVAGQSAIVVRDDVVVTELVVKLDGDFYIADLSGLSEEQKPAVFDTVVLRLETAAED